MLILDIPAKAFYCRFSHSGWNVRDSWTSQRCKTSLPISERRKKATGKCLYNIGGVVQVKALPELWILFSLPLLPDVLYLPSSFFTAIKAAFICIGKSMKAQTLSPDSWARTQDSHLSNLRRLVFQTCWHFARCTLLLCSVNNSLKKDFIDRFAATSLRAFCTFSMIPPRKKKSEGCCGKTEQPSWTHWCICSNALCL